jgi:hypothetical protein
MKKTVFLCILLLTVAADAAVTKTNTVVANSITMTAGAARRYEVPTLITRARIARTASSASPMARRGRP